MRNKLCANHSAPRPFSALFNELLTASHRRFSSSDVDSIGCLLYTSNTQISTALALRLLLFGLFGPFAAAFMNRFGLRRVMLCALTLIAAGLIASLAMTQVWQLVLLWGLVVGAGSGLTAIVLAATVATRWFTQRRGLVVGLLAASSATGQLVFLPLIAELTGRYGWRMALVFVCGLLAAAAVVALALMRDRPSDLDLPPYGETAVIPPPAAGAGLVSLLLAPLEVLREAARVPLFWVLFGTFFICGSSTNGLIQTHFITLCGDYGLTAVTAASVLAMMGVFDFIGTIGSGLLLSLIHISSSAPRTPKCLTSSA